jgi:hypothetical protein
LIPLDDPRWKELEGGYKVRYDASIPLSRLERGEEVWDELWQELHHQGDVGEASYAAVPQLVRIAKDLPSRDWNFYSLVSVIEIERHRRSNPPLPKWLIEDYELAWYELLQLAIEDLRRADDKLTFRSILGAMALSKGHIELGALLTKADESEIQEILERYDAWSELYSLPIAEA